MRLTDLKVKKLTPQKSFFDVPDGDGLYIRVRPRGTKTWIFRYMFDKRPRLMTLGKYPSITLAEARERHSLARQKLEGKTPIDPGREQKDIKKARSDAKTISGMIDEFWRIELSKKKSGAESLRLLKKDVVPRWGSRKVEDIKRRDIVLLIDAVRERAPIGANRVLGALTRFFNFAAERGILDHSPCVGIRKPKETGKSRVLNNDEIKTLWNALDLENKAIDMYRLSKLAMRLILCTGQRPGEVAGMSWDELKDGFWNIPAERMKGKEPQCVPLTPMVLDIIEQARPYSTDSRFVFRSSYVEDSPIKPHSLARALDRHRLEMGFTEETPRFTPHDLRRTVRTRLASLGVSDVVAERVLGHKLQGILAVYNRYDYDNEKREALEQWERELRRIVGIDAPKPGKVVQFKRKSI